MSEQEKEKLEDTNPADGSPTESSPASDSPAEGSSAEGSSAEGKRAAGARGRGKEEGRKDSGRKRSRGPRRSDSESDDGLMDRLVSVNRVAKVVKGGRRFGFAALVVVGDGEGKVGHGSGKAKEISEAIRKANEKAKKAMIKVPLRQGRTLHYDIKGRFGAGKVIMRTAPPGTGIIAGGPMRAVFEVLGVEDVVTKSFGSANPHNMIRATFAAFQNMRAPRFIADKRALSMKELAKKRDISSHTPAPPKAQKSQDKKAVQKKSSPADKQLKQQKKATPKKEAKK